MAYHSTTKDMKNHSRTFKYLKKITQILLPISLFSLLFSHSSISPLFLQSYDYLVSYFSFEFKLFTCTTERNCIFLLCNGILVLIIQSSGLISKITPVKSGTKTSAAERDDENAGFDEMIKKKGAVKAEILEEKINSGNGGDVASAAEVEEDLQPFVVENWDDDVDDEEEDDGGFDTEELEKKCEDFIKRMKLEIQGA